MFTTRRSWTLKIAAKTCPLPKRERVAGLDGATPKRRLCSGNKRSSVAWPEPRSALGQPQLLDPAILSRAERAFHAALGLRTACLDQIDVQLRRARPNCVWPLVIDLALLVRLEDAVAIRVQGVRPAMARQPPAQQIEMRLHRVGRIEAGQQPRRGVVDHGQEHHLAAAFGPGVQRGVHLHQLAEATAPRPTPTMLFTTPRRCTDLRPTITPQRVDRDHETFLGQLLTGQSRSEVRVARRYACNTFFLSCG
ncbi:MAG: hypothetical protein U0793_23960 [Gemmataceae bacterium]